MGSMIYHFLNDSFLFDDALLRENFSSVKERELTSEIEGYRENVLSNVSEIQDEIRSSNNQLRIFGAKEYFSIQYLKQTAFYFDRVILPDPIFNLSRQTSEFSDSMNQFLGMDTSKTVDRESLANAVRQMKMLMPMVAANFLKFFPVSYFLEEKLQDHIPVTYSPDGYSDVLPKEILSAYRDKVDVRSLKKSNGGWTVEESLNLGRAIAIQFKGDSDENMLAYYLFQQEVLSCDEDTRRIKFSMTLPDDLPPTAQFNAWVDQSINKTAGNHYSQLIKGLMLSKSFDASYLTTSEFTHSLLGSNQSVENIKKFSSECFLNINLPFLENISIDDLMRVRQNDGEAFELFRKDLEGKFRELRLELDPEIIKIKAQNALHELGEVQVTKIDQKIKELRKGALAQTAVAIGGLAGSFVTSGMSFAATVIALANGFHTYSEFREKVRENPAYFLWKVKK